MEKRRFLQHSVFLMLSKIVNSLTIFFTGVILTRSLSKADYGTFSQFVLFSTAISLMLGIWLAKSIYYFVPTSEQKKQIVLQTIVMLLAIGGLAGLCVWLLRFQIATWFHNPSLVSLAIYIAFYTLLLTLYHLVEPFFISVKKAHVLALSNIIFSLVYLWIVSYVLMQGWELYRLIITIILLYFGFIAYLVMTAFKLPGVIGHLFRKELFRRQLFYAAPLFLSSSTIVLGRQIDKFIIAAVYPTTDFAVYFRGAIELPIVAIITYTICNMLLPEFVQLYEAGERKQMVQVWHQAIRKTAILSIPFFVLFLFLSKHFITFLYTDRYADSAPIFRIYLLILLVQVTSYDAVVQATGKTRDIFLAALLAVTLSLAAGLVLIRIVGPMGAAIGFVFGQYMATLFYLLRIRRIFQLSFSEVFPWSHVFQILLLTMSLGAITYLVKFMGLLESKLAFMGTYSCVFMVIYIVLIYKLKFLRPGDLDFLKFSFFSQTR